MAQGPGPATYLEGPDCVLAPSRDPCPATAAIYGVNQQREALSFSASQLNNFFKKSESRIHGKLCMF